MIRASVVIDDYDNGPRGYADAATDLVRDVAAQAARSGQTPAWVDARFVTHGANLGSRDRLELEVPST